MNRRQKQVIQSQLNDERATLNKLKGIYKKALDDVNDRLAALKGRAETENLQSVIYQIQYQEALKKQINGILDTLNGDQFSTISEYLAKSYESGFVGAMYDIHGQGVPLIFPIDQDQVVQAVTLDTKLSKPLYNKLGENVNLLKKRVANNISRGIAQGQSYSDIAKNIAVGMVGNYARMNGGALYNAMRITRTEAHRISQQAAYDALKKAKDNGADVVKQWDATLDKRTRPSHARVDGEIRELDEPFSNGLMKPGDPNGRAAEVINCRCQLLQRAKCALDEDELDELKERAAYFGLDKTADFEDFRRKYMPASIANSENSGIISASRYFNSSDILYEYSKKVKPIDGYEDIAIHGDWSGFSINDSNGNEIESYTPKEFAEILKEDPNYHGGNVRLLSCETGSKGAVAAQQLADALNVDVLAPTDVLFIDFNGKMTIGPDEYTNSGDWKLFKPRRVKK